MRTAAKATQTTSTASCSYTAALCSNFQCLATSFTEFDAGYLFIIYDPGPHFEVEKTKGVG